MYLLYENTNPNRTEYNAYVIGGFSEERPEADWFQTGVKALDPSNRRLVGRLSDEDTINLLDGAHPLAVYRTEDGITLTKKDHDGEKLRVQSLDVGEFYPDDIPELQPAGSDRPENPPEPSDRSVNP